jgi:hypothetical protein
MHRSKGSFAAFVFVLLLLCGTRAAQGVIEDKHHALPVRTMIDVIDGIDKTAALSPGRAGELLKVALEPVPGESNEYLAIFRGHGGAWKKAELRLPRGGDGSRFVLLLEPVAPVSMKDVTAHFGEEHALDTPNPAAGDQGMLSFVYTRKIGRLWFSFPSFEKFTAHSIMFDRM